MTTQAEWDAHVQAIDAEGAAREAFALAKRRERIAMAALAGMLSRSGSGSREWFAHEAVAHADALIAALDGGEA